MSVTWGLSRGPHVGGPVKTGVDKVWINGRHAATVGSNCACLQDPLVAMIVTGHTGIRIGERFAAREWDYTTHGGMVREGSRNVFYGPKTDDDRIEMAIDRIRHSKFGQTEEGKKVVERLERLQREDKIHYAAGVEGEKLEADKTGGYYDPKTDQLVINNGGPQKDDVDDTARTLAHEGTHAVIADEEGRDSPNYVDKETRCYRNECELYKEQRTYAPESAPGMEGFIKQKDQEGYVRQMYKDWGHPLPERPSSSVR
jgi:uncharacterized Zn-binding protein involved in type VI secretion